jgi:hypothetical protein
MHSHSNDLLSTSHTQKRSNLLQTQRLPAKNKTPLIMRAFDTNESLEQYYNKLKDSNYKKRLKLQQLQESIQLFSSFSLEKSSSKANLIEKTKEKLLNSITSCEKTTENEVLMTSQLLLMRKREHLKIVPFT